MVRQCAADGCHETDATITTHRFPKDSEMATKWGNALNITRSTVAELQKSFVVCTKHFAPGSYRNEISNSLNTTAIPNLEQNTGNERQFLKGKSKLPSVPARCFKLPPSVDYLPDVQVFRCYKRTKSDENLPVAKKQAIAVAHSHGERFEVVTDSDEPFTLEPAEEIKTDANLRALRPGATRQSLRQTAQIVGASPELKVPALRQKMKLLIPQPAKVGYAHRLTQTDEEPPAQEPQSKENGSKDDKIVALLYPEYREINKVQLIEQMKEKDQRIEALEEKVKKLEQAMRNLL